MENWILAASSKTMAWLLLGSLLYLIAVSIHDKYLVGLSFRPLCTRCCLANLYQILLPHWSVPVIIGLQGSALVSMGPQWSTRVQNGLNGERELRRSSPHSYQHWSARVNIGRHGSANHSGPVQTSTKRSADPACRRKASISFSALVLCISGS